MKGLMVFVYVNKRHGDSSLGGISSKYDDLVLLPTESSTQNGIIIPKIFEAREKGIYLYYRKQFNDLIAAPEDYLDYWYMFGGNFLYTSDGRFPANHPIKIHDRREK